VVVTAPRLHRRGNPFSGTGEIIFEKNRIDRDIPKETLEKLLRFPILNGPTPRTAAPRRVQVHSAADQTAAQFSKATDDMVAFAGKCLEKNKTFMKESKNETPERLVVPWLLTAREYNTAILDRHGRSRLRPPDAQ